MACLPSVVRELFRTPILANFRVADDPGVTKKDYRDVGGGGFGWAYSGCRSAALRAIQLRSSKRLLRIRIQFSSR